MPAPDPARVAAANARRADDVVAALIAWGVDDVFVAPGSRSTPLVLALARRTVRTHVMLDERAAAFCAVGAARVGRLAAIVTTSGTAVANLLPACAEAERDGLGLVCCTADRGVDDVERGASQTLRQPPLLAGVVRASVDLSAPTGADHDGDVGPILDDALAWLRGPQAGPVHLNVRFNKPLEPPAGWVSPPARARAAKKSRIATLSPAPSLDRPGLVVVGNLPVGARGPVQRLVERLGWPVLADVTSGLTFASSSSSSSVVRVPTVALRSAAARAALQPSSVLWVGGLLVEDAVALWLQGLRQARACPVLQLALTTTRRDPFDVIDASVVVDGAIIDGLWMEAPPADEALRDRAIAVAAATAAVQASVVDGALTEPAVARTVLRSMSSGAVLLLGNSMPVRDADRFGVVDDGVDVICNRGAAGIDGCIATALGASLASGRPTTALLGDLAVLHDLSSLAALAGSGAPVRVVVVNNGGGGIFSFLPVGQAIDEATMRRFFETPHAFDLAPVARALGLHTVVVDTVAALGDALASPLTGPALVEVRTDRHDNVAVHRLIDQAIEKAIEKAIGAAARRHVDEVKQRSAP